MIGNDVVDIGQAKRESNWKRKGFLSKVYSAEEQMEIEKASNRDLMVWLLWSMKEAAYKTHQRILNLPRQVNWLDQECLVVSSDLPEVRGVVRINDYVYNTVTKISSGYVNTIATGQADIEVDSLCTASTGDAMKIRLLDLVSRQVNLPFPGLYFKKKSNGIPSIFFDETEVFTQFSFSGHGRFYAVCFALMKY